MAESEREKTDLPWPHWLLRYVGSDEQEAMEDLIWSVGGSPPYGGVSYDEAGAVYELLEGYRGPGAASADAYAKVRAFIAGNRTREMALDIFRCTDEIQSDAADYGHAPVERGLALSRELRHRGSEGCFLAFEAGLYHREGDLPTARARTLEALDIFLVAADEDPVYEKRVKQTAQNAISLTAMDGDRDAARELLQQLAALLDPAMAEQLRRALDAGR